MTVRFHARGDGKVAIYTGSDDDPFDDPIDNLSRVLFHSELTYPAIIATQSGTLSLPSRGANVQLVTGYNLFAHGQAGAPLVLGYVTVGGTRVPLAGSVPVQGDDRGWGRWLALGADTTNVLISESCFAFLGYSAIDVDWVVYVLDVSF